MIWPKQCLHVKIVSEPCYILFVVSVVHMGLCIFISINTVFLFEAGLYSLGMFSPLNRFGKACADLHTTYTPTCTCTPALPPPHVWPTPQLHTQFSHYRTHNPLPPSVPWSCCPTQVQILFHSQSYSWASDICSSLSVGIVLHCCQAWGQESQWGVEHCKIYLLVSSFKELDNLGTGSIFQYEICTY